MISSSMHPRTLTRFALVFGSVLVLSTGCLLSAPTAAPETARPVEGDVLRFGKAVKGDLRGLLTFDGELRAKGRIAVVPRVSSQLEKLYVEVGSRVREGEPIADLRRTELEAQVLESQAAQAAAEARLAQLKNGPRAEVVAQAQANLRAARARLQALERGGPAQAQGELQQRLDEARARLTRTQATVAPNPQSVAQADAAVNSARARLNEILADPARANDRVGAEAAREEVRRAEAAAAAARATPTNVAAVEQARAEVQNAEQALSMSRLSFSAFDLDQARALMEVAESQVNLAAAPASPEEVRAAEARVEETYAQAELARLRQRDTSIVAPIAGTVVEIQATVGSTVGPTATLITLIPPELEITVDVSEEQAAFLSTGQSVTVTAEGYPQSGFSGVLKSLAPVIDPRARTVAARVEVADPQARLRVGTFVRVGLQTAQRQGVTVVPREAVLRLGSADSTGRSGQAVVFAVVNNRLRRQNVVLGVADARNVEIVQGLADGIDVVLNPRSSLVDGDPAGR